MKMGTPTYMLRRIFPAEEGDLRVEVLVILTELEVERDSSIGITIELTIENGRLLTIADISDRAFALAKEAMDAAAVG
jgi:hypothetical protein